MKNVILFVVFLTLIFSCNNSKKEYTAFEKQMEANQHPGKKLLETNCYTCHSPTASQEDRIGPPMIAIKKHYIKKGTTKQQFIADMQAWIINPNTEDAKMFGAVKRFGVMPKQTFPEKTIAQIADYMFDFDIEQPEWFESHFNEEKGMHKGKGNGMGKGKGMRNGQGMQKQQANANKDSLTYGERGLKYALATKAVLGKNLMGTIQKKGTLEALTFCNEKAYPLTDSMSVVHHAIIKRVSDKPRNPNNLANKKELAYINSFKNDIKKSKEPEPIVDLFDNKVHVYYPITTNAMCLQCHGKPDQDIKNLTLSKLSSLYPQDKAIGYGVNEVRGIWSVTFDK
ncbi:c-type heme family protein [Lacinutrix sp. MEBiC02404]